MSSVLAQNTRYYATGDNYTSGEAIFLSDITTYLVEAIGANATIQISMNTETEITESSPDVAWYDYATVTAGDNKFESLEYGPNAIRVNTTGDVKIWIKG